ncbi:ABC1 kinase family protein [Alcaligenes endophyticus]|uniref:AarF/UbiB family protein n=1 Tax=Alcaligenes endophyticus TaxID=1929088 RepID=A0ABT8EI25_9BURK|nr:AarF/UbiB family protein [Alcaligenes endophyticus]MCX5592730.1 AarF/UbiB family protein [Alcaligenes endophyticus]MDN4120918.1 AarF/UbiB family protein [Alcaligenes endophyticus]
MLANTLLALRDHARLRAIGLVVVRFGVEDIIERLGLGDVLPTKRSASTLDSSHAPERLRHALEALGPCFVKLGQILATRADLLGPAWTQELSKLQDAVSTLPWEPMQEVLHEALGPRWRDNFRSFTEEPIAAASMAQVYRAVLVSGEEVIVKVQRPGLRLTISADLRLLHLLAQLIDERGLFPSYRLPAMVAALSDAMLDELDFRCEAHNCSAVREHMQDFEYVHIPRVYMDLCSAQVMVQEFIPGVPVSDIQRLQAAEANGVVLAERGAHAFLHMVLQNGIYHADPHPGNLMVLPGDELAFIDFGLVGLLGKRRQQQLLVLLRAIIEGRAEELSLCLMEWSGAEQIDWRQLDEGAQRYVAKQARGRLLISKALTDLMALARDQQIMLPADLALLFKALMTAEGVLLRLNPQFDIAQTVGPQIKQSLLRQYTPEVLAQDALSFAMESKQIALDAPHLLRIIMHRLRQGKLDARIEVIGIKNLGRSLELAATRLAIAIVTAASVLVLGPVLIRTGPAWLGLSIFVWLGLLAAIAGLVTVLRGFWRRRK